MALVVTFKDGQLIDVVPTCRLHKDCIEEEVLILHRSTSEGTPTKDERFCAICKREERELRQALRSGTPWTCPICGVVTTSDPIAKTITPRLSNWLHSSIPTEQIRRKDN